MEKNGIFNAASSFNKLWNTRVLSKWKDLMVFFQEIICLKKNKGWIINLDEYADVVIHWIALFCNKSEIVYFDSFGAEHVHEEIKEFFGNKNIKANILRIQVNNSVMCGYFSIGFIDFMLAGRKTNWLY